MILPLLARLLRMASLVICVIALASFAAFVLDQTSKASNHQQAEVNNAAPGITTPASTAPKKKSDAREALDKAFSALASPFSGLTAGSSSQWTIHIVDTLLILLVYGFGVGFLARLLRIGV